VAADIVVSSCRQSRTNKNPFWGLGVRLKASRLIVKRVIKVSEFDGVFGTT